MRTCIRFLLLVMLCIGLVQAEGELASSGTTSDFSVHARPYPYTISEGNDSNDILGMAIAKSSSRVYVWYEDGTVTTGSSSDLDVHATAYNFTPPVGKAPTDLIIYATFCHFIQSQCNSFKAFGITG